MIYLDNSATTYPKPDSVYYTAAKSAKNNSFNSGRGGYKQCVEAAGFIYDTRSKLSSMFGAKDENIAFSLNCTQALNMAIKGSTHPGDHILISSLEHNAVARPVNKLCQKGTVEYDIFNYSSDKNEILSDFKHKLRDNTTTVVCMQASNVFGVTFPINEIGKICKDNGILFIVDAAQSAGVLPLNLNTDNVDVICAPGHKGLYGMMGTGFIAVGDNVKLDTIIEGGTGSRSFDMEQPDFLPDRLEPGTLNNSGIISLGAGVDFINFKGRQNIYDHEMSLCRYMYDELDKIDGVTLYVTRKMMKAPILSFNLGDKSSEETAALLADIGIATRAGFHCSPLAHKFFGTSDRGTVRISPSAFTSVRECEVFINSVKKIK